MSWPTITFPKKHPVLVTERLELKWPELSDARELFEMRSNPDFMKFIGRYPVKELSEAKEYIQRIHDGFEEKKGISWKICEQGTDKFIGYIGFWSIDYNHFRTEIGYGLNPNYQQKGYLTEALNALTNYVFNELGIHSIEANADVQNIATIKLLEKCGFEKEAHFKENFFFDGKFLDSAIYSLVKKD